MTRRMSRITVQDAIFRHGLTRDQVLTGIETGQLPARDNSKPGSERRHWRMDEADVIAYADLLSNKTA